MALLEYPDEATADPRAKQILERLSVRLNLFSMLAHAPSVMAETLRLGQASLTRSTLEPNLRELAILYSAKLTRTDYEWIQHVPIGKAVGVTDAQVEALERGKIGPPAFAGRESLVLRIVEEAVHAGEPSEDLVERAAAELGPEKLVELLLTVGYYNMLGYLMRGVRLDLDDAVGPEQLVPANQRAGRA